MLFRSVQGQVERGRRVCERANGNPVDTGFRDGAHRGERDATIRLGDGPPSHHRDGRAELIRRHVVEEDTLGARLDGGDYLLEGVALNLHGRARR